MGLTIHYSGRFKEGASLTKMIEEVKEVADVHEWKYNIYENNFPDNSLGKSWYNRNIYGISLVPPECEPLYLCFLSNGKMSSPANLKFWGKYDNEEESQYLGFLSTKTQYSGIKTHALIVHLLKYISKKYFGELKVSDETGYWETGDEKLLEERFKFMENLLDQVWFGLENFPKEGDETYKTYFERLLKLIHHNK